MGGGGRKSGGKSRGFKLNDLHTHYTKHNNDYPQISKFQYNNRAKELLDCIPNEKIKGFTNSSGWKFRYDKSTNEFAIQRPDGTIATLFKPNEGIKYWEEQVKKYDY